MSVANKNKGFTLLEVIVSMAIFSVVLVAVTGALLLAIKAQRFAVLEKTMGENVRFTLEFMSRQLRFAQRYDELIAQPTGCVGVGVSYETPTSTEIRFINSRFQCIYFYLSGGEVFYQDITISPAPNPINLTNISQVSIDSLEFIIAGQDSLDFLQPRVTIVIQASNTALTPAVLLSTLNVQTVVTQRHLDTPVSPDASGGGEIIFNAFNAASPDATYEAPFITDLQNEGYSVTVISDSQVCGYDYSSADLLIIRPSADLYAQHTACLTINSLAVPVLSLNRHTSRHDLAMSSSSGPSSSQNYTIVDTGHPVSTGYSGVVAVYSTSLVQQRMSSLLAPTTLPIELGSGTTQAGVALKEDGTHARAHWSAHRGTSLTADGWALWHNLVTYLAGV